MAIHTIKRCPFCNQIYQNEIKGKYLYIGSPFIKCSKCGGEFIDKNIHEWLTLNQEQRDKYLTKGEDQSSVFSKAFFAIFGLLFTIFLFVISIYVFVEGESPAIGIIPLVISFVGVYGLIKNFNEAYKRHKKALAHLYGEEIKQSLIRCLDINYIKKLIANGYKLYGLSSEEIEANSLLDYNKNLNCLLEEKETKMSEDIKISDVSKIEPPQF